MGIDKMGIDEMGIDEVGRYHIYISRLKPLQPNTNLTE